MFDPHGVNLAKESLFVENEIKLIPYGICKRNRYISHTVEFLISPPMTLEFAKNARLGSYFIIEVHSSKKAIVITYVIQSEKTGVMKNIGALMVKYGLPKAFFLMKKQNTPQSYRYLKNYSRATKHRHL